MTIFAQFSSAIWSSSRLLISWVNSQGILIHTVLIKISFKSNSSSDSDWESDSDSNSNINSNSNSNSNGQGQSQGHSHCHVNGNGNGNGNGISLLRFFRYTTKRALSEWLIAYVTEWTGKWYLLLRWFLRNKSYRWIFLKLSLNVLYQALFRKTKKW